MGGPSADPGEKRGPLKDVERCVSRVQTENTCLCKAAFSAGMRHVWTAPVWQEFCRLFARCWSELPCVRPLDAAQNEAAGHNALRGLGPGQKPALEAPGAKWVVPFLGPTGVGAL